jgi:hypothetical protein
MPVGRTEGGAHGEDEKPLDPIKAGKSLKINQGGDSWIDYPIYVVENKLLKLISCEIMPCV